MTRKRILVINPSSLGGRTPGPPGPQVRAGDPSRPDLEGKPLAGARREGRSPSPSWTRGLVLARSPGTGSTPPTAVLLTAADAAPPRPGRRRDSLPDVYRRRLPDLPGRSPRGALHRGPSAGPATTPASTAEVGRPQASPPPPPGQGPGRLPRRSGRSRACSTRDFLREVERTARHRGQVRRVPEGAAAGRGRPPQDLRGGRRQQPPRRRPRRPGHRPGRERHGLHRRGERGPGPLPEAARLGQRRSLAHSEFSRYVAPLDAQDFAASVARFGHDDQHPRPRASTSGSAAATRRSSGPR
jgi:hypothetical protein